MKSPTEAQLNDPKWWDENAPENASWLIRPKRSNTKNEAFFAITNAGHVGTKCDGESYHVMFEHWHFPVHRPAKPAAPEKGREPGRIAPEWDGEGYPPVGWHGECTWGQKANWFECVILPHGRIAHGTAHEWRVVDDMIGYEFRSIHALKEQTIEAAHEVINSYSIDQTDTAEKAFGVLYDAGLLHKAAQ